MIAQLKADEVYEDLSPYIGDITPDHIEVFWRDGVVQIPGFVKPELCERVLAHFMEWTGVRWREWPSDPEEQRLFTEAVDASNAKTKKIYAIRQDDPWMFNYVTQRKFGEAVAKLLKLPSVKMLTETLHVKHPFSSGKSGEIGWHQDFPWMPIDRAQGAQFWCALVPVTPEMGPMVHLLGSHREPPGGMMGVGGDNVRTFHPEIFERYEMSEPKHLDQGHAVFHHILTWHSSAPNRTDKVRWAMSSYRVSSACRYTGQHNFNTEGLGLVPYEHFNHPNFPTVYP